MAAMLPPTCCAAAAALPQTMFDMPPGRGILSALQETDGNHDDSLQGADRRRIARGADRGGHGPGSRSVERARGVRLEDCVARAPAPAAARRPQRSGVDTLPVGPGPGATIAFPPSSQRSG